MRHRRVVLAVAALTLIGVTACSHDKKDEAASPGAPIAGATAGDPATSAPAGPTSAASTAKEKPAFTKNPDGTVNSAGPRPATSATTLSAGGFGPYKIGVSQADLKAAGLLGKVSKARADNCADYTKAKGLSKYHSPALSFYNGRLLHMTISSSAIKTDKGVKVGTTLANVKGQYPSGKQLTDFSGAGAWFATDGAYGLLFGIGDNKVKSIQAGMAEPIQFKYTDDQGC
jgi:hypothetical protein